ncbi:hypothetical protein AMTRI_Chr11g154530 [Amborella trichopoda]
MLQSSPSSYTQTHLPSSSLLQPAANNTSHCSLSNPLPFTQSLLCSQPYATLLHQHRGPIAATTRTFFLLHPPPPPFTPISGTLLRLSLLPSHFTSAVPSCHHLFPLRFHHSVPHFLSPSAPLFFISLLPTIRLRSCPSHGIAAAAATPFTHCFLSVTCSSPSPPSSQPPT